MKSSNIIINITSAFYFLAAAFFVYFIYGLIFISAPEDGFALIAVPFVFIFLIISLIFGYGIYKRNKIIYILALTINILCICFLAWEIAIKPDSQITYGAPFVLPLVLMILATLFLSFNKNQFFKK